MKSRQALNFTIFIVIAGLAVLFVYLYQTKTNKAISDYVAKITVCGNIVDENDCYNRDYCQGIYVPTCPSCKQLEFKGCQQISEVEAKQTQAEKDLCQATGGVWDRSNLGNFCLCDQNGQNKKFNQKLGCVSR